MLLLERLLAGVMVVPFALGISSAQSGDRDVAFTFADPQIVESSGLVAAADGLFVSVNDSGDEGRTFVVDGRTGQTVGGASWGEATDVEAIAPWGRRQVLVGDTGDNSASRSSVTLLRVPLERQQRVVEPDVFEVTYPSGPRDAETLLVHPITQQVFIASKELFGGVLYAAPRKLSTEQPNELTAFGSILPIATDGAFFPDGKHLIIRDYGRAAIYTFPALDRIATVTLPDQQQGEGLAVDADGTVFVSTEGQFSAVLRVDLPPDVRDLVSPPVNQPDDQPVDQLVDQPATTPTATPSPESSGPPLVSREARELPEAVTADRPSWVWFLVGGLGLGLLAGLLVVLRSSLRRR